MLALGWYDKITEKKKINFKPHFTHSYGSVSPQSGGLLLSACGGMVYHGSRVQSIQESKEIRGKGQGSNVFQEHNPGAVISIHLAPATKDYITSQ